jgi:hypothetical protein
VIEKRVVVKCLALVWAFIGVAMLLVTVWRNTPHVDPYEQPYALGIDAGRAGSPEASMFDGVPRERWHLVAQRWFEELSDVLYRTCDRPGFDYASYAAGIIAGQKQVALEPWLHSNSSQGLPCH